MHLTVLGAVIIPLSLSVAGRPVWLVQLALVTAVFEAGAALLIGSFGFPVAMVPGLIFILFIVAQYALGMRYAAEGVALRAMLPLLALLFYALLSITVLPQVFGGTIMVWPQKIDPVSPQAVPLAFGAGNITQTLYLSMNVVAAVITALFLTRTAFPYQRILAAYLLGGYIVVGLSLWQFASRVAGVPFPTDILYSNSGWAIVEQSLGSVPRIQGPFSEPAGLAFYLSGVCFCTLWLAARGYRLMNPNLLLILASGTMLLSTSTTGIVTLALGFPLVTVFAGARSDLRSLARLSKTIAILILCGSIVIGPVFALKPSLLNAVDDVITATLTKSDSESYTSRTGLDADALAVIGPTYGLGVGWGSFRTSSLVPGLVANAGVFGVLAVLALVASVARLISRAAARAPGHPAQMLVDGFAAALCGQLTAAVVSAPTIGSLAFFLQLGCLVGAAARMCIEPRLAATTWPGRIYARGSVASP
jgi:hypothetical protein